MPVLVIAGSLARNPRRRRGRHVADAHAAVRRADGGDVAAGRSVDVRSRARARTDRRTFTTRRRSITRPAGRKARVVIEITSPVRSADRSSRGLGPFAKLSPRRQLRNPVMFTVFVGSVLTTALFARPCFTRARNRGLRRRHCGLAVFTCCLRTSPKRWPRVAARPKPTPCDNRSAT